MNRFAMLTVRQMLGLLYYLGILAHLPKKVKDFFLTNLEKEKVKGQTTACFLPPFAIPMNIIPRIRVVSYWQGSGLFGAAANPAQQFPTRVPGSPVNADSTSTWIPKSLAISTLRSCSTCAPLPMSSSIFS